MINIDYKYVPFVFAFFISILIFVFLLYFEKKKNSKKQFNDLLFFIMNREELFYLQIKNLIDKFKTYSIGNNEEHAIIIEKFNEALNNNYESLKKGIVSNNLCKTDIGKDEKVNISFNLIEEILQKKRIELKEMYEKLLL